MLVLDNYGNNEYVPQSRSGSRSDQPCHNPKPQQHAIHALCFLCTHMLLSLHINPESWRKDWDSWIHPWSLNISIKTWRITACPRNHLCTVHTKFCVIRHLDSLLIRVETHQRCYRAKYLLPEQTKTEKSSDVRTWSTFGSPSVSIEITNRSK